VSRRSSEANVATSVEGARGGHEPQHCFSDDAECSSYREELVRDSPATSLSRAPPSLAVVPSASTT